MMLSHFYHHHLLLSVLSCDKQDLYFALQEKIKTRPIAARGGRVSSSTFDRRALGFAWRHPRLRAPAAETRKDALKARLQHLRVRPYKNIASPSSARPALQHRPALSAGGLPTCMRDPLFSFSLSTLVHFSLLFIIRASSQFLAVSLLSSADHWARGLVLFSAGERHRRATSEDVSHITCY